MNLWCSDYIFVVNAFPDREFALHMFTVSVPKAAVYFFSVVFISAKNRKGHAISKVHTWGMMRNAQI